MLMKKSKIYLLQGNFFYSHVFKENLHNLGYRDVSCFIKTSEMMKHLYNPPDIIIYDFDVDCFEGEKNLKSISVAFPKANILFSCFLSEKHLIPRFLKCGASDSFIKDQHEMKSVANMLEKICSEKIQVGEKLLENISQQ